MARFLTAAVLACAGAPLPAADTTRPDELVAQFVAAWNAHDAPAFGKLFASDADWVTASGKRLHGRDAIVAYLGEEHASWARATRMQSAQVHVRRVDEATAAVFFEWQIAAPNPEANAAPRRGNNLFVAARTPEGWTIVAGQVARNAR
jgi:uncharacterized protein (TIGR02246 family)